MLVFTIGTTACNSGNGEQVYFHNSDAFIENHTSGILDYESISYEEYADFKKITPRAPMGSRVFDLTQILGTDDLPDTEEMAERLKNET